MKDEPESKSIMAFERTSLEMRKEKAFVHDEERNTLTIVEAYPYEVDLDRIQNPTELVCWVHHLCGKKWVDADLVALFMELVCEIKRWPMRL